MDSTCGLGEKLRDIVLNVIWEDVLYLVCYGQNVEQLNEEVERLTIERRSIQLRIDEARNNVEQIDDKVLHWMGEVHMISEQVEQLHKESQSKRECTITSCPDPWLRYKLSKRAKAMAQQVAYISGRANFPIVAIRVPPPLMLESTSYEGIDSRVRIKNQIIEALRDPSVNMVGLCGLGGVGKTTIAKNVTKEEDIQKMFKTVIMATVSQEMNIGKIQDQIIDKLGMKLNERTEEGKAFRLFERLKKENNMLLILDDLWEELDLLGVGIPFVDVEKYGKKIEGCKILLTSRNVTLLSNMQCQQIIKVGVLSEDEAWELFKRIVELPVDSSIESIATEIVQQCGGLPLAIATAAKTLKDQNIQLWKDYLARLKHPLKRNFTGIKVVDFILRLSYDYLSSENKRIFLLAAMMTHDPLIEDLLMYSMGLDILEHAETMAHARGVIFDVVRKLKSLNLFLDSFSIHRFTIDDVYRDLTLSFDELKAFIVRHRRLNEWPDEDKMEHCRGICLQESDISVLPEELHGPMLELFLLNNKTLGLAIPYRFFKSSYKLKLLALTNVHCSSLTSLGFLENLKSLCLHSCVLEDITTAGSLRKLKVLSLAHSEIEQLPIELANLTSLQMLNLSHCSKLKVIPQKLLSSLKELEVLYMRNSFNRWNYEQSIEANENTSIEELRDLPISSLDIHIPNVSVLPDDLFLHMKLERYKILIGKHWKWWQVNDETSKILGLDLESSNDLTAGIRKLMEGVEDLYLYGSNGYENVLYNHDVRQFLCLKHLQIESNDDIKYIVSNSSHHEDAFPILESLQLKNLKSLENLCEGPDAVEFRELHTLKMENLPALTRDLSLKDRATNNNSNKSLFNNKVLFPKLEILELSNLNILIELIWDDQLSHNSFNNLKTLTVQRCGFMKLVPFHVLKSLNKLEEMEVGECEGLEVLFDYEADLNDYKEMVSSTSVVVPLKKLKLWELPNLKNVCSNPHQVLCLKLEILKLSKLNNMISLTWNDQLPHNFFSNLKALTVDRCGFVKLVPLHVLKSLNKLEELEVRECEVLEMLFDFEDLNHYEEMSSSSVVVPLKKIKLSILPKLKNVWSNQYQGNVSFQRLRSIDISSCESLTSIFLHQ